jgi:hypothetical protein
MKLPKRFRSALLSFACAAAALLAGGCEHDNDSFDLWIHASDTRLHRGDRCELMARLRDGEDDDNAAGEDFTWSLSDPSAGRLSRNRGRRVEYVPTRFPAPGEGEFVQTVYCKFDGDFLFNGAIFNHHTRREIRHLP